MLQIQVDVVTQIVKSQYAQHVTLVEQDCLIYVTGQSVMLALVIVVIS